MQTLFCVRFKALFRPYGSTSPIFGITIPQGPRSARRNKLKFFICVPSWIIDLYILRKILYVKIWEKRYTVLFKNISLHYQTTETAILPHIKKNYNMNYSEFLNSLLSEYKTAAAKKRFLTMEIRELNNYKAEIKDIIDDNNGIYGYRYGDIVTDNDIAQVEREIKTATELRKTL